MSPNDVMHDGEQYSLFTDDEIVHVKCIGCGHLVPYKDTEFQVCSWACAGRVDHEDRAFAYRLANDDFAPHYVMPEAIWKIEQWVGAAQRSGDHRCLNCCGPVPFENTYCGLFCITKPLFNGSK